MYDERLKHLGLLYTQFYHGIDLYVVEYYSKKVQILQLALNTFFFLKGSAHVFHLGYVCLIIFMISKFLNDLALLFFSFI